MTARILIGDVATTVGPLKPTGKIRLKGQTLDASSEGVWIDADKEVVVVGGQSNCLTVRLAADQVESLVNSGEPAPAPPTLDTTPLQSPLSWVERINAVATGCVLGVVAALLLCWSGTPLTMSAALLPLAGGIAGRLFQMFVGSAIESAGPREDHRPAALGIAVMVIIATAIGGSIGLNLGHGFVGLSCGVVVGALVGGSLSWLVTLLQNL